MFHLFPWFISVAVAASVSLSVHWSSRERQAVTLRALDLEERLLECLESSRQAKVRFEMQLCRKRVGWFDACSDTHPLVQTIEFDAITESYKIVTDRWRDEEEPITVGIPARAEALRTVSSIEGVLVSELAEGDIKLMASDQAYIRARTVYSCRGGTSRTLAGLSQILTFGLLNVVESDSPWIDFDMQARADEPKR
jgi:hypothetical protein